MVGHALVKEKVCLKVGHALVYEKVCLEVGHALVKLSVLDGWPCLS